MEPNKYKDFINWKVKPLKKDDPKSLEEYLIVNDITQEEINEFVGKPEFADDILAETLSWAKTKTPEMLHILYDQVRSNKSVTAVEKFLTIAHELNKKKDEKSNNYQINFFGNIDDDKFKRIAAREVGFSLPSGEEAVN
jgi:hypothetical protein